jgi:hypothetical protein
MDDGLVRIGRGAGLAVSVAVIVVLLSVSAASGLTRTRSSSLALVPLPKAAIGAAVRSLRVQVDTGVVSNAEAASENFETARAMIRSGRVSGWSTDYGDDLANNAPVGEITSEISEWRNSDDARRALTRVMRLNLSFAAGLLRFGIATRRTNTAGPKVGSEHAAYTAMYRFAKTKSVYCAGEKAAEGRYLIDVSACGASREATQHLFPVLIRRLDQRLRLALAGELRGKPVRPARYRKPGPPADGPKPAALALGPGDVPAKTRHGRYEKTGFRSSYELSLSHAGPYVGLHQGISLAVNGPTAKFWAADYLYRDTHTSLYDGATAPIQARSVDLSGVPDHALGQIVRVPFAPGRAVYHGHIALRHGPWLDFITAVSNSPIHTSDLRKLARLATSRLDTGLRG